MSSDYERALAALARRLEEQIEATWWQSMTGQRPQQPYIDAAYRVLPERQRALPPPEGHREA